MILDLLTNTFLFVYTIIAVIACFRHEGHWDLSAGLKALRYFTILSNLFCAVASLLLLLVRTQHGPAFVPWLLKYVAVCSVTVTFLTVMVFLGPSFGYKAMLAGRDLFLHLCGPLLALISFCFMEREYELSFFLSLLGILPVIVYGFVYLYEVVIIRQWDDFYGYNKNGKWPVSMAAMFIGGFLVCMLVRMLYHL